METILVTGGAGFIGSHVCETLINLGHKVICVDNFNDYYDPNIKHKNISNLVSSLNQSNFVLYEKDIRDKEALLEIFEKERPNKVIHLAAMAGVRNSLNHPELYFDVNVMGTLKLLELCKKFNIKQFVFGSSSSVYGDNLSLPLREDLLTNPMNPYALTKQVGEELCKLFSSNSGMNIVCLRFFTVYGPRGRPDMAIPNFTKAIIQNKELTLFDAGALTRDFTYVIDTVNGIIASLNLNHKFEIINIGNGNNIPVKQIITLIEENTSNKANIINEPRKPGEVMHTKADISKASALLNYVPAVSIEEGINNFVNWYSDVVENEENKDSEENN